MKRASLRFAGAALLVAVLVALPWYAPPTILQFGIRTLILATLAQAWNIIGGYAGYPSFGNSVFYGLGIYGTAIAMAKFHLPFAVGLPAGAALAVLFALLLGLPVLRLRGHYFAIATLALAEVMSAVISNLPIAGEAEGLVLPLLRGDWVFYELALALTLAATLTVLFISRSRFGYGLIAIREDEEAAAVTGVNTTLYKVLAFALSSAFTGIAGGIYAYWITFIDPSSAFDLRLNVEMIIMAVFGGPGSVLGPVLGALALSSISQVLASELSSLAGLFFGIVIVAAVVFMPRGVADVGRRFRRVGLAYFWENVKRHRL